MNRESKSKITVIIALVAVLLLVASASLSIGKNSQEIIRYTELRINLEEKDATFEISYNAIPTFNMFFFILGTHHMDGYIDRFMYDFDEYEIIRINKNNVVIKVKNMSVESGDYYLHYSKGLGAHVDRIVYVYPDGSERVVRDMQKTLNTYYDKQGDAEVKLNQTV